MLNSELVNQFVSITGAPKHVAEHILEAHNWEMDAAVNFYLESGGVGHGASAAPDHHIEASELSYSTMPAGDSRPLPASAAPRSEPIEILDEDNDDAEEEDVQVLLASNIARNGSHRRHVEDILEDEWYPGLVEDDDGDSDNDDDGMAMVNLAREPGMPRSRQRRRERRRERTLPEVAPFPAARLRAGFNGGGASDIVAPVEEAGVPALPDDVDMEEQRMLLAAMTGEAYQGRIPDFHTDPRYQQRALSPGAQEREYLRQEQDAAYSESLAADRERETREREEVEAAEAAKRTALAKAREAEEAAAALDRELDAKEATLPPEPPSGDEAEVALMVRLPAGGRLSRRFRRGDPLSSVFDWVDVSQRSVEKGHKPGTYNLVSQFPRRVFEDGGQGMTLEGANLAHKQEALFVVPKD